MTGNTRGRKRGTYGRDACPRCGAVRSNQKYPVRSPMIDMSVMQSVEDLNPVDGVVCEKCGMAYRVTKLDVDDGYIVSRDEFECVPNYCPRCGAEVVE